MREHCRSVLFSRLSTEAASFLGRAEVPNRLVLPMEQMLSEATFGVSRTWRSKGDLAKVLLEAKRFLGNALGGMKERLTAAMPSGPERLELTLKSVEDQDAAIDALLMASPLGGPAPEPENQTNIFDILDGGSPSIF
jgi:hypothetical protein